MLEFNATFIVAMLSFSLFIIIMNVIFYRPILSVIKKREDYINSNLNKSKEFETLAGSLSEKRQSELDLAQKECRDLFKKCVEQINSDNSDRLSSAKDKSKVEIQNRKTELNNEASGLSKSLEENTSQDLASVIVSKIIGGAAD